MTTIPQEYGYVLATLVLTGVLNQYQGILVGNVRKDAKVPYPNPYATHAEAEVSLAAYRFNCAQRAHANLLENMPQTVISAAIAGLRYPLVTSGLMGVWLLGRFIYAQGYIGSTREQKGGGRYRGVWYLLGQFGLMGVAGWSVFEMLRG